VDFCVKIDKIFIFLVLAWTFIIGLVNLISLIRIFYSLFMEN